MTFRRAGLAFALQHLQGVDDSGTGVLRFDDQIDHTSHRSLIWCGKVVDGGHDDFEDDGTEWKPDPKE